MNEKDLASIAMQFQDVEWLIKLRAMPTKEKILEIFSMCPCCTRRIIRQYWVYSDADLQGKLNELKKTIINEIQINQLYAD